MADERSGWKAYALKFLETAPDGVVVTDREGRIAFWGLFEGQYERGRVVGKFLAVLELAKAMKIHAEQNEPFGEIWLVASIRPPVPIAGQATGANGPEQAGLPF